MYIARLEFKRIQTFLFSSPRLKDMVGANALLGDIIRKALPELVVEHRNGQPFNDEFSYKIVNQIKLIQNDPLYNAEHWFKDDPAEAWKKGVLSRDGGHFYAVFEEKKDGEDFIEAAKALIQADLPGTLVEFSLDLESDLNSDSSAQTSQTIQEDNFPPLPIFQPCEISDSRLAEQKEIHAENGVSKATYLSNASKKKRTFVKTDVNQSANVASQLTQHYLSSHVFKAPDDLLDLVGNDYLSLIVADGNSMGSKFNDYIAEIEANAKNQKNTEEINKPSWLEKQAHAEAFYYNARASIRTAVHNTLNTHLKENVYDVLPFQLLMLGGDDILIVCRASIAFDLIAQINDELTPSPSDQPHYNKHGVTLGAGVAIASHNLPFYRLHHIAEELASSAKILARSDATLGSTIDWQIVTQAWIDDPITYRQQKSIVRYTLEQESATQTLILSQKPYPFKPSDSNLNANLATMLEEAQAIREALDTVDKSPTPDAQTSTHTIAPQEEENTLARSQLRYLDAQLALGKRHAENCFNRLPTALKNRLSESLSRLVRHSDNLEPVHSWPWASVLSADAENSHADDATQDQFYVTPLSDLIELLELPNHQNTTGKNNR